MSDLREEKSWLIIGQWQYQQENFNDLLEELRKTYSLVIISFEGFQVEIKIISDITSEDIVSSFKTITFLNNFHISKIPSLIKFSHDSGVKLLEFNIDTINHSSNDDIPNVSDLIKEGVRYYEEFETSKASFIFNKVLLIDPLNQVCLFNLACIYHFAGLSILSLDLLLKVLQQNPNDEVSSSFLWAIANSDTCPREDIINIYKNLASKNLYLAETRLSALTGQGKNAFRGDAQYIQKVFDNLADDFEDRLVNRLSYDAPTILKDLILTHLQSNNLQTSGHSILDLGCGSGLLAKAFSQTNNNDHKLSFRFTGIDLSSKMIEICKGLGLYERLECMDIFNIVQETYLYDIIVAADTFIYVGALGDIFHQIYQILNTNGLFAFSTEDLTSSPMKTNIVPEENNQDLESSPYEIHGAVPGWGCQLLKSARFGHSHEYIVQLANMHSFKIVDQIFKILRYEEGTPLYGYLYILVKV